MLAGLKLCLARSAFFIGPAETRLRALLEASREAQNAVSEKLSNQVLAALYELLRGLHRAAPAEIEALAETDAHHLYEGLLTCLMRLVFLLYAEDRDLLPSSADPNLKALWDNGYSIKTLYARLTVDEALNPDTMDERRGGWGQLLAVFRLIHGGHPDWVTGRGGKLFDPDAFPFLEGRAKGSARADAAVWPVSDGTVLRILHGLMTVEGRTLSGEKIRERLSYRSLDVESIGSVYETVMGFTAARASERMIALRDKKKLPHFVGLETLLAQKANDRAKWLKDRGVELSVKQAKSVKEAGDVAGLLVAFGSAVDERASPDKTPTGAGAPYLQPTEERRRSGSHYTPRSLTEPIVRRALEPVFARLGETASPEAVLSLRVLDPACGSGAFLVEACRQLGARLEQAWNMHGAEKPRIPPDEDEALHARRLVAQKCLYGVDKNPMAVDLARLSLWLATLARDHEFTFLDHALKSGDSLVGLTRAEIAAAHWDASKPGLPLFRDMIAQAVERAREGREAIRNAGDDVLMEAQAARYLRVLDASEPARIVGDAVIAAFFAADKPKAREEERQTVESWIAKSSPPNWEKLRAKAELFHFEQGWRPFHWEIDFPEVFVRENPGFDAIVGNPPFLGGRRISLLNSLNYFACLSKMVISDGGSSDLIAYFFRRAFNLCRNEGTLGLIATSSITEGETRFKSLLWLIENGATIYAARDKMLWPGEANVHISTVNIFKGTLPSPYYLNEAPVDVISSALTTRENDYQPETLTANRDICFEGCVPYGDGFIFDDENMGGHSIKDKTELLAAEPEASRLIRPYVGGDEITELPVLEANKFVIFTGKMEELELKNGWPLVYDLLKATVKPLREAKSERVAKAPWWQFLWPRMKLIQQMAKRPRVIVTSRVAKFRAFNFMPTEHIPSTRLSVIAKDDHVTFAIVQSRVHELWALNFGTNRGTTSNYSPSSCFETFPFPQGHKTDAALEIIGKTYHEHRAALMVASNEGMTKIYNRFHKSDERADPIHRLRALHDEMDRAILRAYGWHDLADELHPEFLTEETEDDHTYQGRYFWPSEARDRVLARLQALNAARHKEEVAAGLVLTAKARASNEDDGAQPGFDL